MFTDECQSVVLTEKDLMDFTLTIMQLSSIIHQASKPFISRRIQIEKKMKTLASDGWKEQR